jgi:hypothetical protein
MAERVVDDLELVEVDAEDANRLGTPQLGQQFSQFLVERYAIGQPSQGVEVRQMNGL